MYNHCTFLSGTASEEVKNMSICVYNNEEVRNIKDEEDIKKKF